MTTNSDFDKLEFLIQRYYELRDNQMQNNQIIHTTYYISIVFFGAMISFLPELSSDSLRLFSYLFASGVFISMLLWTHIYIKNRKDNEKIINMVLSKINSTDTDISDVDDLGEFFPDPNDERKDIGTKATWRGIGLKEFLLYSYYLGLSAIALILAFIDFIIVP